MPPTPNKKPLRIILPKQGHRTFAQMLRKPGEQKRRYTAREMIKYMQMAYNSVEIREKNPSLLTLGDVVRLAHNMLLEPVEKVAADLIVEIQNLPPELHPLTEPEKRTRVGRPKLALPENDSPAQAAG